MEAPGLQDNVERQVALEWMDPQVNRDLKELEVTRVHLDLLAFLVAVEPLDQLGLREDVDLLAQLDLRALKANKANVECKEWLVQLDLLEKLVALGIQEHLDLQAKLEQQE